MKRGLQAGFTLLELLGSIAIVAILATVILSAAPRIFGQADVTRCVANQKYLFQLLQRYALENNGLLPAPTGASSWWTRLGLMENPTYEARNASKNKLFICPAAVKTFPGHKPMRTYAINTEGFSMTDAVPLVRNSRPATTLLLIDGKSNQDDASDTVAYFRATSWPRITDWVDARHDGKFNGLFLDGHVQLLSPADPMLTEYVTNFGR